MPHVIESTPERSKEWLPRIVSVVLVGVLGGIAGVALLSDVSAYSLSLLGLFLATVLGWLFLEGHVVRLRKRRILLDVTGRTITFENYPVKGGLWSVRHVDSLKLELDDVLAVYSSMHAKVFGLLFLHPLLGVLGGLFHLTVVTKHGTVDVTPDMTHFEEIGALLRDACVGKQDPSYRGRQWVFLLVVIIAAATAVALLIWAGILG